MTTADEPLLSADAIFERKAKPQALAALWSATEQQSSGELTLPPALPSHMQLPPPPPGDPPWVGRAPSASSMPVRARLSPMPAISPWSPSPLQTAPIADSALRPLAPINVPVPAAVSHAMPVALPTTVPAHLPANGTAAASHLRVLEAAWNDDTDSFRRVRAESFGRCGVADVAQYAWGHVCGDKDGPTPEGVYLGGATLYPGHWASLGDVCTGESKEKEENLRSNGNLFQEPDSTLLLSSGR